MRVSPNSNPSRPKKTTTSSYTLQRIVLDVGAGMLAKPDDVTGHAAHFGGYLSGAMRACLRFTHFMHLLPQSLL